MIPNFRPLLFIAAIAGLTAASPLGANSLAGSYLAASQASYNNDFEAAARYYSRALADDPDNTGLMQNALLSFLSKGDLEEGLTIARRMETLGADSQLAQLILLTEAIRDRDFAAANAFYEEGIAFSPLLDGLLQGWIYLGLGRMSDAIERFDALGAKGNMKVFSDYHKALALAAVGDFEAAEKIMQGEDGRPLRIGRGSLIAHIQMLSQLDRNPEALAIIEQALNGSGDLEIIAIRDRLEAGETISYDFVTNASEGAAEVYLTLASVLAEDQNERFALIYGRLSEFLRPASVAAILIVADLLNEQGQYQLAVRNFNKVPSDHSMFYSAEIGRAEALQANDQPEAAIEVLRGLSKTHKTIPSVFTALGDALRRQSRFAEATEAYNAAIALLPDPQPNQWFLYYTRGITYERQDNWPAAEADFRFSLELSPDQPLVLNYLGYGLVEKRIHLEEAQKMIEKAVEMRPDDGYITDSLGWVLYRVGKFDEAVPHMERAVELIPDDPIVNDHLGDTYWMVGRKLEAAFQWRRALSFGPEPSEAQRIRDKLELGLDEVLKREAAENAPK